MRFLSTAFCTTLLLCLGASGLHAQTDDFRPLVLTGADTPSLLGAAVTAPVCYSWSGASWTQCPLQIDERDYIDRGSAYRRDLRPEFYDVDSVYHYTAPQDYPNSRMEPTVPFDSDLSFDANDELVLMARFFGQQANLAAQPPPFSPEDIEELAFEGRYVYLFVSSVALDQSAGYDLVDYDFNLLAGDFPDDYDFTGDHFDQYHAEPNNHNTGDYLAANPEYSPVETEYYRLSFEDRWIQRELQFADAGGTYGPDILDRVKVSSRPDYNGSRVGCGRTIWTGSAERGTLGIQKDGPLRAIRYAQGYNSGGFNHILYRLYEKYMVYEMAHTMHQTPGASMWYDLAPSATGMTYYSNLHPSGVTVDGVPDYATSPEKDIFTEAYLEWDYLIGSQGSMVGVWEAETNITTLQPNSYYEDDTNPDIQNCSGDRMAYGNFGNTYFEPKPASDDVTMRSTDPREPEAYFLDGSLRYMRLIRRAVPEVPGLSLGEASAIRDQLQAPVEVAVNTLIVPGNDATPPQIEGSVDRPTQTYAGTATDIGAGLSSIALAGDASNLALNVASFAPGAASTTFTLTPINPTQGASGTVVVTDERGNASDVFVQIGVPQDDVLPPRVASTTDRIFLTGEAADDRLDDTGLASITLVGASNLAFDADPFTVGTTEPVAFRIRLIDVTQPGSGTLRVDDVQGLRTNEAISMDAPPTDATAPVVAAERESTVLEGTITETQPNDLGIATIEVVGTTNMTVEVDPFDEGAQTVAFTATSVEATEAGTGTIRVTDLAGNVTEYAIDIPPSIFDLYLRAEAPVFTTEDSGTVTAWLSNIGTERFTLARVQTKKETDVEVDPNRITVGELAPGDSAEVVFTFANAAATGSVQLKAIDQFIGGNEIDNANNLVDVFFVPSASGIVLVGDVQGDAFTGTARASDNGLASLVLSPDATNLTLSTDPFTPGTTASVAYSVERIDPALDGSGTLIATDQSGSEELLAVELLAPGADTQAPVLAGNATGGTFEGTASDDQQNDSGLASVALDAGATNLTLTVDPFDAGAATTTFTVTLTDPSQPGSGRVEAIDMVGNTSGLDVELDTAPLPDYDIVATATYAFEGAADGTITVTVRNIGANAMPAVRVIVKSSQDVTLAQSTQVIGEIAAGASRDAVFDFSNAGPNAEVFFQAQDTQIRRGESDLDNNEVTIAPVNEGGDVAPPVIGGSVTLNGSVPRFDGTASETGANDTGVASIALANGATNVALTVDPFIAGATNVGFAVTLVDDSQSGSGTVEATDVEGNVAVYEVALVLAGNDTSAPTITGTFRRRAYEGTATDDQPNDTGIASVTLSNDAVNMVLDVDPFTPGDPVVTFKLSAADPAQPTSGTVVATDVAGNEGSTFLTRGRAASSLASDEDAEAGQRHAEDLAAAGAVADAVEGGKPSTETDAVAADATEPASHESDDREAASEAPSGVKPQTDAATPEDASSSGKPSLELATDAVANDAALTAPADASEAVSSSLAAEAPLSSLSTSAEAAPSDGTLSVRAYPNPVTAAATLRFHVPSESAARIAVYDLSGRRVALVHDGTLSAGWHDLIVDARRWPSGVYLWRVETATQAETGRFTVIR